MKIHNLIAVIFLLILSTILLLVSIFWWGDIYNYHSKERIKKQNIENIQYLDSLQYNSNY